MAAPSLAAQRYVRWLYSVASAQPSLALLIRVADAVAMLEDRPRDLEDGLHDELALMMAGLDSQRLPAALAIARLRPSSPVLVAALRHPAMRLPACAALACHLDDERVLDIYLGLLSQPDLGVVVDALAGLSPSTGLPPAAGVRAPAERLSAPLGSRVIELLDHQDQGVVAAALRVLEGRDLSDDLLDRVVGLLGHGGSSVTQSAGRVLKGSKLPSIVLGGLIDLLLDPEPWISASARLALADRDLPEDLLARAVNLLEDPAGSAADHAASLLAGQDLPRAILARVILLMEHADAEVRLRALRILENQDLPEGILARIVRRLEDTDPMTALRVLSGLSRQDPGCVLEMLPRVINRIQPGSGPAVVTGAFELVDGQHLPEDFVVLVTNLLGHEHPAVADTACVVLGAPATPEHMVVQVVTGLDHDDLSVVSRTLRALQGRHLPAELVERVAGLLQRGDPGLTGEVLLLLETQYLPESVLASLVSLLEAREPVVLSRVRSVLKGRTLPEPLLELIRRRLHDSDPTVVVAALHLLAGRELPHDVLSDVVGLVGHQNPALVWTALSALEGQPLPEALVLRGLKLALHPGETADVATCFLRGRLASAQAASLLSSWLGEEPASRWQLATELQWPAPFAAELAVHVRAMTAAKAVQETAAWDGLAAKTAERWLAAERSDAWATIAQATVAALRLITATTLEGGRM